MVPVSSWRKTDGLILIPYWVQTIQGPATAVDHIGDWLWKHKSGLWKKMDVGNANLCERIKLESIHWFLKSLHIEWFYMNHIVESYRMILLKMWKRWVQSRVCSIFL